MYQDGVLLNWHCSGWQGPSCQLIAHQQERDNLTTDRVVKKGSRGASKSASKQGGASRNSTTGQIAVGKFEKKQQLEVLASFFGPKLLCYWKHLLNWSSPQKSLLRTTTPIATILFNLRHFLAQPPNSICIRLWIGPPKFPNHLCTLYTCTLLSSLLLFREHLLWKLFYFDPKSAFVESSIWPSLV